MIKKEVMVLVALLFTVILVSLSAEQVDATHGGATHGGTITIESIKPSFPNANTLQFTVTFNKHADAGDVEFTFPTPETPPPSPPTPATLNFTLISPTALGKPEPTMYAAVFDPLSVSGNTANFTFDVTSLTAAGTITGTIEEVTLTLNDHTIEATILESTVEGVTTPEETIALVPPTTPHPLTESVTFFNVATLPPETSCPFRLTEHTQLNKELITTCTASGNILLFSPQFGATQQNTFTTTVFVNSAISDAKTCGFAKTSQGTPSTYEPFSPSGIVRFNNNVYHEYEFDITLLEKNERLYARCGTTESPTTKGSFPLAKLSGSNPSISLSFTPQVITESPFTTLFNLSSSQEVVCKLGISDTGIRFTDFNHEDLVYFPATTDTNANGGKMYGTANEYDANTYRKNYNTNFPFNGILDLVDEKTYTVSALCKNKQGVTTMNSNTVRVNTREPLKLSNINPPHNGYAIICTNTEKICFSREGDNRPSNLLPAPPFTIDINLTTNKIASCNYNIIGEEKTDMSLSANNKNVHKERLSEVHVGTTQVEFTCTDNDIRSTSQVTATTSFFIDITPPVTFTINDSSSFLGISQDRTYRTDRLNVSFTASDTESGIDYYAYKLLKCDNKTSPAKLSTCSDFYPNSAAGNPPPSNANTVSISRSSKFKGGMYITTKSTNATITGLKTKLLDGYWYRVEAFAVNKAGVANDPILSDGIRVDTSLIPFSCSNNVKDGTETDVDCGGECGGCDVKEVCAMNSDCTSNKCTALVCEQASCSDEIRNGKETDVDCGGSCSACTTGDSCSTNADCSSGSCSESVCVTSNSCANNKRDVGETDTDCGGICATSSNFLCGADKSCLQSSDCATGLGCTAGTCLSTTGDTSPNDDNNPTSPNEEDSASSGSGFPFGIVLPILFIIVLVGVLFGIRYYKKTKDLYSPTSSFSSPPPSRPVIPTAPIRRPLQRPIRSIPKRRHPLPKPTRDVANKMREIPYLSGEDVFDKLKQEVIEEGKRKPSPKKRKV